MKNSYSFSALVSFSLLCSVFALGFLVLLFRLKEEQVDKAAVYRRQMQQQSFRRAQTVGLRGRILDRNGVALASNRAVVDIVVNPESFRSRRRGETTAGNLITAIERLGAKIGRKSPVDDKAVKRHLSQSLAQPLKVWRDVSEKELALFCESEEEFPGFECAVSSERCYPYGMLAAHVLGRTGRDRQPVDVGDGKMNFVDKELCGRDGIELQYDSFLRGMPGEDRLYVDARGYATSRFTAVEARNGFDLRLTLDASLQNVAERQFAGCKGAFVALDPRDGSVRAMVSAPSFDPRLCVPVFPEKLYVKYRDDPAKPLLNRAVAGQYAPGSTFKPLTALAAMSAGIKPSFELECIGYYEVAGMRIRCARTWGHGEIDLPHALKESCNPYFCALGVKAGTNAIISICREFGLGQKTGIDFPVESKGIVPDASVKERLSPGVRWYSGDVAQTSIGQGLLLVSPLQMALVASAIGTGNMPTPRLSELGEVSVRKLNVPKNHLDSVREGMRMVVDGGTGRRAGKDVEAYVIGKTGTAEVGSRENRRKNTWFIAYCEPTEKSRIKESLALAIVVEDGESGGGTAAPKVCEILKSYYGEAKK